VDTSRFEVGQSTEKQVTIGKDMTTNRTGNAGDDVLSTPAMLGLMEGACIDQSQSLLEKNSTTVGYAVDGLRHIARTDVGEVVDITTSLTDIDREKGRLTYEISVTQNGKPVGKATHKRAIISSG
jgi:predicted thioesterase